MKKIVIIVPNLRLGGQERIALNTAELLKKDYEVILVIFDDTNSAYSFDGKIINLNVPAKEGKLFKIWNVLKRAYKLRRLKKREDVDFCYSFGESANLVNVLSGKRGKSILSIHGYADLKNRFMDRFLYKRGTKVVCCSKEIEKRYQTFFPAFRNSKTLYNPYPLSEIFALGQEEVTDFSFLGRTLVSHGRLEEVKNYPRLIRAFSILSIEYSDIALLIIGEGTKKKELEHLVMELGLSERVFLIGFRANPFSYLSKSAAYVLSSYHEGFPNALAEGMVFLPAVSVDAKSGPAEMLADDFDRKTTGVEESIYGILVEQEKERATEEEKRKSDASLAEGIKRLLEDESLYFKYKKAAYERVSSFSEERYRENLINILEEKSEKRERV